ncbi:hypothetical protein U1Q18_025346 [Sarracenia purpurea var. burkii]
MDLKPEKKNPRLTPKDWITNPRLTPKDWITFLGSVIVGLAAVVGSIDMPKADLWVIFAILSTIIGLCAGAAFPVTNAVGLKPGEGQIVQVQGGGRILRSMEKKRSLPFQAPNVQQQQQPRLGSGSGWNPNGWDWDSVRFRDPEVAAAVFRSGIRMESAASIGEDDGRTVDGSMMVASAGD